MAIAPVRDVVAVFSAIEKASVALPLPSVGLVSVIHEGLADAVQGHVDADAVSVTLPVSPAAGAAMVAGDTVKVHAGGGAAAACVTVKARPAIVSVAERSAASVLALTANCT
jgi:hypothetical protein